MKTSSIILLLFSLNLTVCFSQKISRKEKENNKTTVIGKIDTVDIDDQYRLIVSLPSKSIKSNSTYEGGYFVSYYIPSDTVVFSVYSGKLSKEPFITGQNCIITDSLLIENVFFERKGFCLQSSERFENKIGFFKEKEYIFLSFVAKYEWVNEFKVKLYDKVFDDIQIIEK